jgi:ribosomal protein S18 acetylase RimI-like enzyme
VSDDLAWRVEAACRHAWPCERVSVVNGWLICASGGITRRTNSVNPLPGDRAEVATALEPARRIYSAIGQSLLFRVPAIAPGLDADLDRLGFGPPEAETITLHAMLAPSRADVGKDVRVGALDEDWLAARARLIGWDAEAMRVYGRMLGMIAGPVAFASARFEGQIVAVAYGALTNGLLVIESVVTDSAVRRRGFGRQVVAALLDWARGHGIEEACLQVVADNDPALALYDGLGFGRLLYRYHYRREVIALIG